MATTYQPTQWLMPDNANANKVGNYSFDFDGTGDLIDCGDDAALQITGPMTISYWFKGKGTTASISGVGKQGATRGYSLGLNNAASPNTNVYFAIAPTSGTVFSTSLLTTIDTTLWYHIVGVYDPGVSLTIYLNGAQVAQELVGVPASQYSASNTFQIGNRGDSGGYRFVGNISEVSIFNYALDATGTDSVDTLYGNATNGVGNPMGFSIPPVGYWKGDKAGLGDQWAVPNQVSQDYVFDFNGSSDYVQGPVGNLASAYTQASWSFWFKASSLPVSKSWIYSRRGANDNHGELWGIDSAGKLIGNLGHSNPLDGDYTGATTISTGIWYNVVVTYDGSGITDDDKVKVYLNSDLETLSWTGTVQATLLQILGAGRYHAVGYGGASYFNGNISNVAVWYGSTLTSGNATSIYNNGTPGDLTSLSPNFFWWKLDDSATFSTNWSVPDDSGNSNTGTSSGMTQGNLVPDTVTRGIAMYSEYSFDFDGTDDYIELGSAMATSGTDWSITCWFKSSQTGGNRMLVGQTGSKYFGLNWNKLTFFSSDNTFDMVSATNQNDGNWHNVTYTYNYTSGAWKSYIDGVVDDDQVATASVDIPPWKFFGSRTTAVDFADATLNNIAYFATELSAANVTTIYNNGRPTDLTDLSPVGWWKLGEEAFSTDPAADPNGWTVPDQIGSNDGTSSGNPDLVGEAPQSFANGLSVSMDIDDRIGESGFSDNNALSYNMDSEARTTDTAP